MYSGNQSLCLENWRYQRGLGDLAACFSGNWRITVSCKNQHYHYLLWKPGVWGSHRAIVCWESSVLCMLRKSEVLKCVGNQQHTVPVCCSIILVVKSAEKRHCTFGNSTVSFRVSDITVY